MTASVASLFYMLVFPGFLFLGITALFAEYLDRKIHARLQHRIGPPWFQPFADMLKLVAKQDVVPDLSEKWMFKVTPIVALAAAVTAFFYIPIWSPRVYVPFSGVNQSFAFQGDLIIVLYLLFIPTVSFFLGGWYSRSVFSMIGAARTLMQLFAYEVPLFLSILGPAMLADTWSISGITEFYSKHPAYALFNVIGFAVALVALLGKLEKVPFDIPEAETEIVGGSFTEYSGRRLALFRLTTDIEMVVGSALLAAVFLPFGLGFGPIVGLVLFFVKLLVMVVLVSLFRTLFARLRIDQMINFCWQVAAPVAFAQILIDLAAKGVLTP